MAVTSQTRRSPQHRTPLGRWLAIARGEDRAPAPTLRLTCRPPQTEDERAVARAIAAVGRNGVAPRDAVLCHLVADWLATTRRGAAATDPGIWGPWVLLHEATRLLASLEGDLVTTARSA